MAKVEKYEPREYRIAMEAIVDAYGPEEQAMGWYYYLDDKIQFPFEACCSWGMGSSLRLTLVVN